MSHVIAIVIYVAFSTVILAATLCIICDKHDNPFMRGERAASWLRCLGLVFVVTMIGLVPTLFGALLAVVCWFGGIMFLFGQGFWRTLVITCCNTALGFVTLYAIERMLLSPDLITVPVIAVAGLAAWCGWRRIHRLEPLPSCPGVRVRAAGPRGSPVLLPRLRGGPGPGIPGDRVADAGPPSNDEP